MGKKASEDKDKKGEKGEGKDGEGKGKGKRERNDDLTIIVKGLAYDIDADTLRNDFAGCGEIVRLNIPKDSEGNSKGAAFIEYKEAEALEKALEWHETFY